MQFLRIFLTVLTGILGAGAPAAYSSHKLTKETIGKYVSEDAIPNDSNSNEINGEALKSKLFLKPAKTRSLRALKNTLQKDLKSGCFSSYNSAYKSAVLLERSSLLSDVRNFCVISIQEQLKDDKRLNFSEEKKDDLKSKLTSKLGSLKSHDSSSGNVDLEEQLKSLKDKLSGQNQTNDSDGETLRDWCKSSYDSIYHSKSMNKGKLVNLYCVN